METLLYSFLAGTSTIIGVFVLMIFGEPGNKVLASLLGFAAGIMLAISVFELMAGALVLGSMTITVIGVLRGAFMMW